ncbi:peptidyl-prolyl cis-trans isomerase activity [Vibrio sp. B1FLJ16]|uniref:peptidyl-prolyl cis-trans isomerase n=2 Tax=Vibrio sp. B1FLJ16 TaxID=2751178 RepID=UPI001AF300DC|nr:peptidyl-prolyl cis-trans isomerase [Vibrio sp. B1FLJ16]CAD7802442.1 peptidyl-prolyl cis-trans isomerase activity [Vibrio sp. B1FLJ16]CAE6893488.1 peptidyl-prolyl cis-trans isomerase activity [Vibrio sp. B1FLJ16]
MNKWMKEPLLHFVLLGVAIFLVYSQINTDTEDEYQIVINDNKINHIRSLWELQWKREPTFEELKGLLERYTRQEIMYQEALKLNLDEDDEIIKRRLSQKMEFMANDLTKVVMPPSEENLLTYFDSNKEKYIIPASYSLKQVTFNRNNHDDPKAYAKTLLAQAEVASESALTQKGDPVLLPSRLYKAAKSEITKAFGNAFYAALDTQPLNVWAGPISSGLGEHLVFISEKESAYFPDFASVRNEVQRDYEFDTQSDAKGSIYKELKKKYKVVMKSELLGELQEAEILASLNGLK